ncbi:tRNA lysidine(34) synthetase TilS [Halanaerobacter jeridensis]|uniref:tRNA(Ile)-lysidine synthase n=1 Tax=Halanaerobacter jeridensis TaxID=706427 RepID=A0A938XPX9_9FIRM|nr:tRNA lysidine(34) synthetase TilS [Halanaerobacter jeridensis]MBM7557172.1 tRNA(Ile)-lysidine synthase [Halanaerobacter jeridensis]
MKLLEVVKDTITKYQLLDTGDKVLVGVSGGLDSVALIHILKKLATDYDLELHIAHLDHQLRGADSAADAKFVEKIATQLNVPITSISRDVKNYQQENNLSLENAARQVRYDFFFNLLDDLNFDKLAVAHHANDQAETILMKFLRGAGLKGLGGIKPDQEKIIRPLIEVKKEELKQYCFNHDLKWRIDETNQQEICFRNKVRLNLLPQLIEEYNENLINNLNQMGQVFRAENDFLVVKAREKLTNIIIHSSNNRLILAKDEFLNVHFALQRRIIREIYKRLTESYKDLYFYNVEEILQLIKNGGTGTQKKLPQGVLVKLSYQQIIFMLGTAENKVESFSYRLQVGEEKEISDLNIVINSKVLNSSYPWRQELDQINKSFFDLNKVGFEFEVRQRKDGDLFQPLGMSGTKKLKDFFIDEKIKRNKRDKIPIFTTATGDIFWVSQLRIDEKYKVTNKTDEILMIEIKNLKED